jgi:DNA helicase MCM8
MENIKVSNAILSRFDLVFLLLDDPDLQRDKKLSEHVMKLHSRNRKRKLDSFLGGASEGGNAFSVSFNEESSQATKKMRMNNFSASQMGDDDEVEIISATQDGQIVYSSLWHKIKSLCEKIPEKDILQPQLLKKYISYAKHTVFPKLSIEACEVIKDFYITLRENAANNSNTLPITSRQLDSLIRLSQARAKLEFRNLVTREDAMDVVKLVQESIFEACYIEMGTAKGSAAMNYNYAASQSGVRLPKGVDPNNVGMLSIPKQTKIFVEKLRAEAEANGDKRFDQ